MKDIILSKFGNDLNVAIVGASGGLGNAFVEHFLTQDNVHKIHAFSRSQSTFDHEKIVNHTIDITKEESVENAILSAGDDLFFDIVIIATGFLHGDDIAPEKSMRDLSMHSFEEVFAINTFGPAMCAKYFLPRLRRDRKTVFACLSARVGSISDNELGGWYAYRASKAALNMILKNAAIEMARRYKEACIIGLHPGTVDTSLSKPYQGQVKGPKLFTAEYSSACLLNIINHVTPEQSGKVLAWDRKEVPA